jgi:hypothetical protein
MMLKLVLLVVVVTILVVMGWKLELCWRRRMAGHIHSKLLLLSRDRISDNLKGRHVFSSDGMTELFACEHDWRA